MQQEQPLAVDFLVPVKEYDQCDFIDYKNGELYALDNHEVAFAFWEAYCRQAAIHDAALPCLGERPPERHHVVLGINPAFAVIPSSSLIDEVLVQLVKTTQGLLSDGCAPGPGQLSCLVLAAEKTRNEEDAFVLPVRLHFPFIGVSKEEQAQLASQLPGLLEKNVELHRVTKNTLARPWHTIVETDRISTPSFVPLYGSGESPLYLRHFWGDIRQSLSLSPAQEDLEQLHPACDGAHPLHEFVVAGNPSELWLPAITSVRFGRAPVMRPQRGGPGYSHRTIAPPVPATDADERTLARYFVYHLSPTRFTTRHYWRDIGQALQRAFEGDAEGLELFIAHSARHGAFDAEACAAWYGTRMRVPITYRTLAWYMRRDSPAAYTTWHEAWVMDAVESVMRFHGSVKDANKSMAEAIYRCFWLDHVCVMQEKGTALAYFFANHRWVRQRNGDVLRRAITRDFPRYLVRLQAKLKVRESQSNDADERDALKTRSKLLDLMQQALEPRGVRSLLYGDVVENFNEVHRDFSKYENGHFDMYACANGVLHAIRGTGEILFREGKPEDYITIGSDTIYHAEWTLDTPAVRDYVRIRSQVHTDPEVNHYMHKVRARELLSGNSEKKVHWHIGPTGQNGKTTWVSIDTMTHGDYAKDCPQTPFDIYWDESKPSPFLYEAMDAKMLYVSELSREKMISSAQIKRQSGNDPVRSRMFRENGGAKVPAYVVSFAGNVNPTFYAPDDSTRERNVFVPYDSRWVPEEEAPATEAEQWRLRIFPKHPNFEAQKQALAEAGLWYRVYYFPIYAKEGIEKLPRALEEEKERYWRDYDSIELFKRQMLAEVEGLSVSASDLHEAYSRWYVRMYPKFPVPTYPTFKTDLVRRLGPPDDNDCWQGWTLNSDRSLGGAGF